MDPVSAMATASAAFSAIKKGFSIGRDIEAMASDLSRWMGALSDLDQAEKEDSSIILYTIVDNNLAKFLANTCDKKKYHVLVF